MKRLQQFLETLKAYSPRPCLDGKGGSHTYLQLFEESDRWQSQLDQLNVEAGTVVGLRADYSLATVAVLLALLSRHAIVALIPRDRADVQYLADACATGFLDLRLDGQYSWHTISRSTMHPLLDSLRDTGDGGVVLFTSGSTGRPKAALQSTERFLYKYSKPGRQLRTLAFLRFDHIAGLDTLFYTLVSGGTLILTLHRDPRSILVLIESHEVEVLPTSPSFLRLLCATKAAGKHNLSSLKIITYGSEPMDPSTLARLNTLFPDIRISQKYGTTETGSPRTISRGNNSLWLKLDGGTKIKIIDGVLWMQSESTILGYLNAPSPVDDEGWYCTGDQVEVEGEWMRFRGRTSDTISVGGEKVAPVEVEQSILELDFVRDVVVAGEADPLLGQVVTARVSLDTTKIAQKEAATRIWKHCRQRLASYKAPVKIHFSSEGFSNDRHKAQRNVPASVMHSKDL
jgi:acyl-coenzyme A synthetase/AMP-(fatty) acid ligase